MKESYILNPRVGWRRIGKEVVVFNCENQEIAIWNETASLLWEELVVGRNENQLVDFLTYKYGIPVVNAKQDLDDFMSEIESMNLLIKPKKDSVIKPPNEINQEGENVLLEIEMMAIENLIPFAITFEMIAQCNEKCIHCYLNNYGYLLSFNEIKRILNEISRVGCLFLSLTGGEFFMRRDAMEIIEYAGKLNFVVDILSNGTLISLDVAEKLSRYSVRRVQISLYGATPKTHDSITQLPGSFDKTIQAIHLLKEAGIKVEIAFPLMRLNFNERYLVKELAESLGCLISPSHLITARNNGDTDTFDLRINDEEMRLFWQDYEMSSMYAGRKPFNEHLFYLGLRDLLEAAPCYSGFNSCAITPTGKVLPCNQFLCEVGDLRKSSFEEIWLKSEKLRSLRNLKIKDLTTCSTCKLLHICTRCPGLALLEGGDLLGISQENCRITSIRNSIAERR